MARRLTDLVPTCVTATPLARVSPSLGERLLACELSVAFRLDGRYDSLRRQGTAAALGDVAHNLAERVAAGAFDQVPEDRLQEALTSAWGDGVERAQRQLADAYDAAAPPPATRWPGYAQTATRTLELLLEEARGRRQAKANAGGLHLEKDLRPEGVPLHGRADRVESRNGATEIIDLKTGWTLPDELKRSHRRQLLAYSFLWHATHGEWPLTASIQRLDGERMSFVVAPAEAEAVATELMAALDRYNQRVADRATAWDLAVPNSEGCRHCPYRLGCEPFFAAASPEWEWYRRSVMGDVTRVTEGRAHTCVEVETQAGTIDAPRVRIINWPSDLAPTPGERVAVVDASPTAIATDIRLVWDSAICRWQRAGGTKGSASRGTFDSSRRTAL